jgi:fibronectin-binding autotransporter adhesin
MKINLTPVPKVVVFAASSALQLLFVCLLVRSVNAADKTWDGGGDNSLWQTGPNWDANTPPAANDRLVFSGTTRLNNTNNFAAGTVFNGVSFNSPAGAFILRGNSITLGGGITDNQVVTLQSINLPLTLNSTRNVDVVTDGSLLLSSVISGAGGISKTGGGLLTLDGANTFTGPITIDGGALNVASDANLGTVPGAATTGSLIINGGTLRATASFALEARRGLALGPATGIGTGIFDLGPGITVTYGGIAANNGPGTGGLTKFGFGGLTLSGANSYTGPTAVKNGALTLDFTQAAAPVDNIINANSSLTLGGATSGRGTTNFAALIMNGKANTTHSQTFNGTTIDLGETQIRANSGNGGSANLALGSLTHVIGGVVNVITPALIGGTGNITTTASNVNGIIAGWAMVSDGTVSLQGGTTGNPIPPAVATNFASVDATGNIVAYTNYTAYNDAIGSVGSIMFGTNNVLIGSDVTSDTLRVDADHDPGPGTTFEVNTITFNRSVNNWSLNIGINNTLRLGKTGALFSQYRGGSPTWGITSVPGGVNNLGQQGNQDVGILTAGGPTDNTPGEIIIHLSQAGSASANNMVIDTKVTDNGTGPVTIVKAGPGFFKLRGHNTYSGGTYVLQGRLQLSGSEVGTSNPDGIGTGPLYIFPGAYLFFAGTGSPITNAMFIAGNAARQEQGIGAIRTSGGWQVQGTVTLIGDATIGGNGNLSGGIAGKITGPFALNLCSAGTVNGTISISNPSNDWTGTTTIQARTEQNSGNNNFISGASEVIPNGFGKDNVILAAGATGGTINWNLNGFNETINGLFASGIAANCSITNGAAGLNSMLTVGDNDQSGTFGGIIRGDEAGAGTGTLGLTKIGGGVQTLTGANTYSGPTIVNGGTLALTDAGSIAASPQIVVSSATLDVSGAAGGFSPAGTVAVNNGAIIVKTTGSPGISSLALTNSRVRLTTLGGAPNIQAATLTTGGATNLIDLISVGTITSYPTQFTIIKYSGSIAGAGFNFALGDVPSTSTDGFISNNVANSSVDLYLRDGPKPLNWTGVKGSAWDIGTTTNWLAFGLTQVAFLNADSVFFYDSALTNVVDLTTALLPGALVVSNLLQNFTFTGNGSLSGFVELIKDGPGTLTVANNGLNDFKGGVRVNGGSVVIATDNSISGGVNVASGATLQVGTNAAAGSLPSGNVLNEGALIFSRLGDLTAANTISGTGSLTKNGAGLVTLNGSSTYDGPTIIAQGTLKAGTARAFGSDLGMTTVSNAATLDVGGQTINTEPVSVSGAGANGQGAIINTGGDNINALRTVTLSGDTTFGGTGRWDIRNTGGLVASLSTGGNAYNLTKAGQNQFSLVGVEVDAALANINVQQGMFSVETTTTTLGSPAGTLTVNTGATLQFWNTSPTLWDKMFVLNGDGLATTLNNGNGDNTISGSVTLNGICIVNAGGTSFTFNGVLSGPGSLTKTGGSPLALAANNTYTGNTRVDGGRLLLPDSGSIAKSVGIFAGPSGTVDVSVRADGTLTLAGGQTLAGDGTVDGSVVSGAGTTVSPGASVGRLTVTNALTLNGTTLMELDAALHTNDVLAAAVINFGGVLSLTNLAGTLTGGDSFKLFDAASYTGTFGSIVPATPGSGMTWDTSELATSGRLKVAGNTTPPEIGSIAISAGNVVIGGTGGAPGGTYFVLTSTNIALPVSSWSRLETNVFGAGGTFSYTNALDRQTPQRFYILQLP